jgi:hypothetical protein
MKQIINLKPANLATKGRKSKAGKLKIAKNKK